MADDISFYYGLMEVIRIMEEQDPVEVLVREEALKRWLADGWLEDDFEEKGLLYRRGVLQGWLMPREE